MLRQIDPPREICPSVEEFFVEAEGRQGSYFYAVLRSKDTGEYIFLASVKGGLEDLWDSPRYPDYSAMLDRISYDYALSWSFAG